MKQLQAIECYLVLSPRGDLLKIESNKALAAELCFQQARKAREEKREDGYMLTTGVLTYDVSEVHHTLRVDLPVTNETNQEKKG